MAVFQLLLKNSISLLTVFLFGSTGEIVTEKSGHLNMGIPGIIALGGLGGVIGECLYINNIPNPAAPNVFLCIFIPIIFTILFGAIAGLLFSFFTVSLRCNQNVVGLCLTTFGVAITTFFFTSSKFLNFDYLFYAGNYFKSMIFPGKVTSELNFFVEVLFSHGFLTYFAILIAILVGFTLKKTNLGLAIRSVGENPSAADSTGINVTKYRYLTTMVGAMIASLGGLYLIMDHGGGVDPASMDMESYGWLAVALVIFSMWKPSLAILGSFVFSILATLPNVMSFSGANRHLMEMLPYVMTIIVLIVTSVFKFKSNKAPESLGLSYFREDR